MPEATNISLFTNVTNPEIVERHQHDADFVLRRVGLVEPLTTPSGVAATFADAALALMCAVQIQRSFEDWGQASDAPVRVGVGMASDEAQRITSQARSGEILVTEAVRALAEPRGYLFSAREELETKNSSLPLFSLRWWEHD
jgi:class 3 adenylate cyclase